MKRLIDFVSSAPAKNTFKPDKEKGSKSYCAVSVRFFAECACEGIQKLEAKLRLSVEPPAFLETKQRFLLDRAPPLPFPKCTLERSCCRYIYHSDRRERDRRYRYDDPQEAFDPGYVGLEQRVNRDRRRT